MPEGPSIVLLKESMQHFTGQTVITVRGNSKAGIDTLQSKVLMRIESWGKHLLLQFNSTQLLRIHFMLFGSYAINERKDRNERLGLDFSNGEINFYACSVKFLEGEIEELYDFTADVMGGKWKISTTLKRVKMYPNELIADVLLDQEIFAGVGNIIKNEVLYRTRIHPQSIVKEISDFKLKEIIKDTRVYSFQFLEWKRNYVLRKNWQVHTKQTCPKCLTPLEKVKKLGKKQRRAFFCTKCQKLPKAI